LIRIKWKKKGVDDRRVSFFSFLSLTLFLSEYVEIRLCM
jgi:hypothetical protein